MNHRRNSMYGKSLLSFLFISIFCLAGHVGVLAQTTSPVSGTVELQKADNSREPVVGALIEVYRVDIKSGFPSTKTDKKGEFRFAGMQLGAMYAFAVSAPNCAPVVFPNVKAGQEKLLVTLRPGDGKKLTEDEARKAIAAGSKSSGDAKEISAEDKKAQDDYEKKYAENQAARKKAEDANKIINAALKEGAAAFQVQNFDLAIAKFDEGYNADPEYEGSAPILLTNKGLAHRERGIVAYNQGAHGDEEAKRAGKEKAKPDFEQAIAAFEKALEILEKAPPGDAATQAALTRSKIDALKTYVTTHGVMAKMQMDSSTLANPILILDKYLAAETDDAKKLPVLLNWSNDMRGSGQTKTAIHGYRIVLEKTPDNVDALAGIGLSLFAEGVASIPENKEQEQEGLNFMQKFADTAPDTHPLKASVKESVDYLKNTAKLAPQKVTPTKKKP